MSRSETNEIIFTTFGAYATTLQKVVNDLPQDCLRPSIFFDAKKGNKQQEKK